MVSIKFLFFIALAIACVVAAEEVERVKKQVFVGGYGYPYAHAYSGLGYAGYAGYPYTGYHAGLYGYY